MSAALRDVDALVVGAGVAGLGAAHALKARGFETALLDPSTQPGGVLQSVRAGDYLFERGPNTIAVKAPALALLRRLGLEDRVLPASPASRLRFLYHDACLEPLPTGLAAAVTTPLLSPRGKLRVLREPFVRRGDAAGESVHEFCSRRLGPEASERLVGAFLTGVYAGDERELGAEAVFPQLVEAERESGSIVRGLLAARRRDSPRGLRGIYSTPLGLGDLAAALAEPLGDACRLGVRAERLARDGDHWRIEARGAGGDEAWSAKRLVLAAPAAESAALVEPVDATLAAGLRAIAYAPIVSVAVAVDPARASRPLAGFGFLVPRAAGLRVLGCLFMSNLFPGRAPSGHALMTIMLGGVRWPEAVELPDDVLRDALAADLERTLGLRDGWEVLHVARWPRAVPQPARDHVGRVRDLAQRAARLGTLELAGAWKAGVGVSDALASGLAAGDAV